MHAVNSQASAQGRASLELESDPHKKWHRKHLAPGQQQGHCFPDLESCLTGQEHLHILNIAPLESELGLSSLTTPTSSGCHPVPSFHPSVPPSSLPCPCVELQEGALPIPAPLMLFIKPTGEDSSVFWTPTLWESQMQVTFLGTCESSRSSFGTHGSPRARTRGLVQISMS